MIPARQHTLATVSLTVADYLLTATTEILGAMGEARQAARVQRWLNACLAALPKRKPSRGADREADALFRRVSPHIDLLVRMADDEARAKALIALFWACAPLLVDARTFCPEIVDVDRRAWDYLLQTLTTLCEHLQRYHEDADTEGHSVYCQWINDFDFEENAA